MTNMLKTIIAKSDQLNADDLMVHGKILKITGVKIDENSKQPCSIFYEGDDGKPYKPCLSMRRVLVKVWTEDQTKYVGRSIKVFCDPNVTFGPQAVGGVRISHMSDMERGQRMLLTVKKGIRKEFMVQPLKEEPLIVGDELEMLIVLGNGAAESGTEVFTAWGEGITPLEREAVNHLLRKWFEQAKAVDAKNAETTTETKENEQC